MPRLLLLLAGLALVAAGSAAVARAASAPPPVRLYELAVVRFVDVNGQLHYQTGLLPATGGFRVATDTPTTLPAQTSPGIVGKTLIFTEAWTAFNDLGPEATANFERRSGPLLVGGLIHYEVGVREDARTRVGVLVNLSARGRVTAGERMIGGFVVEEQSRRVLVRAIGPALGPLGVGDPLPDPYLTIFEGSTPIYYNDDWEQRGDADEVARVSARVGAFPLPAGSKDAALLVELPPGHYTAHVESVGGADGVALVEVYRVDD